MGQRIVISEEEKKEILSKYLKEETKSSIVNKIYNRVKDKPIIQKLETLAHPDFKQFVSNVVREFPKLKSKENELINQGQIILKNPDEYLEKNISKIDQLDNLKLTEQTASIIALKISVIFFFMMMIYTMIYGKKIESPSKEATDILKQFEGKTLNLYNDEEEQYLFGTDKIKKMEFIDVIDKGRRNYIRISAPYFGVYEVTCLANPDRLAPYLLKVEKEAVGVGTKYAKTFTTKDPKFNKKFTDKLNEVVVQFCKVPSADFSNVSSTSSQNMV